MFVERQRLGVEAFKVGAEYVEKLIGRRIAAFFFAFENHNLSRAHSVSDLFAERRVEVRPNQQHHVETAGEQCNRVAVVIEAKHGSHWIAALLVAGLPIVRPVGGSDFNSLLRKLVGQPAGTTTGFEHLFPFAQGCQCENAFCRK